MVNIPSSVIILTLILRKIRFGVPLKLFLYENSK